MLKSLVLALALVAQSAECLTRRQVPQMGLVSAIKGKFGGGKAVSAADARRGADAPPTRLRRLDARRAPRLRAAVG